MKLLLILLVLITTILNNKLFVSSSLSSTSTSTECIQSVTSVSEVNPLINDSLVIVEGTFCTNNVSDILVILYVPFSTVLRVSLNCNSNVTIDTTGSTITCRTADPPTLNVNFTSLSLVRVETPLTPITSFLGISDYIFTDSTCLNNCNGNGVCDVGMNCRCNQGYASFDCSHQVLNKTVLSSPYSIVNDSFAMSTDNEQFNIRLSHVIANSLLENEQFNFQVYLPNLQSTNLTNSTTGYSYIKNNPGSWLTNLYYSSQYMSSVTPSFSYINFNGAYLPMSSQSTLITIYPTINSTSRSYAFPIFSNSSTNASYSLVLELSSIKGIYSQNYEIDISENGNSVAIIERNTKSLLVFTLSDIYDFKCTTVAGHANIGVAPLFYSANLIEHNSSNVYILITFGQTTEEIKSGNYTIQLIVNSYNLSESEGSKPFAKWVIGVIAAAVGAFIIGVIVVVCIQRHRRKGYHHIQDHHHHNHY